MVSIFFKDTISVQILIKKVARHKSNLYVTEIVYEYEVFMVSHPCLKPTSLELWAVECGLAAKCPCAINLWIWPISSNVMIICACTCMIKDINRSEKGSVLFNWELVQDGPTRYDVIKRCIAISFEPWLENVQKE